MRVLSHHAYRVAAVFAGVGLVTRFIFRGFETRWQIIIFWIVVAAYQFAVRPLAGRRVSIMSFALDIVVVTIAIASMKVAIEGQL